MSLEKIEPVFNNVLLALQLSLGVWQFMKLTPIGALIRGMVGYLLRPFRLSTAYGRLRECAGRVFKRATCYVLQGDIPSESTNVRNEDDAITFDYLGTRSTLERSGSEKHILFIDGQMRYYIIPTVWEELLNAAAAAGGSAAAAANAAAGYAAYAADAADYAADADVAGVAAAAAAAACRPISNLVSTMDAGAAGRYFWRRHFAAPSAFVKGRRDFWEEVITGGVMSLEDVCDGIILDNQRISISSSDAWLLPVNLSVSEEKLLKILNLVGLFLQTRKVKVHWLIPTALSLISALLEFSTKLRVWLYSKINVVFSYMVHFLCDPLPRSWRRQIYSLGKYVENLRPGNDIELKIKRGNVCAIIAGCAKVDKEGATLVPWLNVVDEDPTVIVKRFTCDPIHIKCTYFVPLHICQILAPTISVFHVECKTKTEFEQIITLVSCIAKNRCGTLRSYGPNRKVSVRGFKESVISYVKSGRPSIYELELGDVVVT